MVKILKYNLLFFVLGTFLISWICWVGAYVFFSESFLLQLPLMRLGAFAPALVSMLFCFCRDPGRIIITRKRIYAFLIVWLIAFLHFYLYLIFVEHVEIDNLAIIICATTSFLPAFVLSAVFSENASIRQHLSTIAFPKGHFIWYIIAFLLLPFLLLLDVLFNHLLGNPVATPTYNYHDYSFVQLLVYFLLILTVQSLQAGGLSEEPGWRGYLQRGLQNKYSPLLSGLIVGFVWGLWHFPVYLAQLSEMSPWIIILGCLEIGLLFTWIYNRTGGSLLAVIILHASWNTFMDFLPRTHIFDIIVSILLLFVIFNDKMWEKKESQQASQIAHD